MRWKKKINVDREERGEREHHMRQKKGVRGKGGGDVCLTAQCAKVRKGADRCWYVE